MNYAHEMPFGAAVSDGGEVRFRLWAPDARSVTVDFSSGNLPMRSVDGGWFELKTSEACPGDRYQFRIDDRAVPDPASRFQPLGVHGPSEVIDPKAFLWKSAEWRGRPWEETVLYELHVGTFSAEGTYRGAEQKLDYLSSLGITAVEIMPVSSFPGKRNWGYDGVLPYAPSACYGRPEDLKHFIDAAHKRGLMVFWTWFITISARKETIFICTARSFLRNATKLHGAKRSTSMGPAVAWCETTSPTMHFIGWKNIAWTDCGSTPCMPFTMIPSPIF